MDKKIYNLLLIEDSPIDVKITERFLHKTYANIETFVVSNGQEALDFLRDESSPRPNLILLDMHMPVLDGPSFISQFKVDEAIKDIPVIVFSADKERAVDVIDEDIKGYVIKTFNGDDLIEEINKFIL